MAAQLYGYGIVFTTIVAVGPIALNPSNFPINLHLMHLVRQLLAAFLIKCINRQHSQIHDFLLGESGRLGLFLNDFLNHGTDRDRSISFGHEE